jgi:hypothetical protein
MQAAVFDFGSFAEHSRRAGSPSAAALQRTHAVLAARLVQPESRANGFGRAVRAGLRGTWQWLAAAAAILALSCAAVVYLSHTVAPRVTEPAVAAILIAGGEAGIGTNPFVPSAATQAVVAARHGSVRNEGGALVIDLRDAPMADAVKQLASITGSLVVGQPTDARINLQWRGTSTAAAWQALLGDEAGYALACDLPETATRCRVWLANSQAAAALRH